MFKMMFILSAIKNFGSGKLPVGVIFIVLIFSIACTSFFQKTDTKQSMARFELEYLSQQLEVYRSKHGSYPTTKQGLQELVKAGCLKKPDSIFDPWQQPWHYLHPGIHNNEFDLFTWGGDGQIGGEGNDADITNW